MPVTRGSSTGAGTVLIIEDEAELADLYAAYLRDAHDVVVAYTGEEALDVLSDKFDVLLLDRRMPGLSGDEVLAEIRERGYDCSVVMVTAVDPDFDIVEMGFDDYLVKPVSKEELLDVVDTVHARAEYASELREYYSLTSKKALLEAEKSERELEGSEEYADLVDRVGDLSERVDDRVAAITDHEEFVGAFRDLPGGDGRPDIDARE